MSVPAVPYWSVSKRAFIPLDGMHDSHLMKALAKFERGEYQAPPDPDDPLVLAPISLGDRVRLGCAFDDEMKRRGIGRYAPGDGALNEQGR